MLPAHRVGQLIGGGQLDLWWWGEQLPQQLCIPRLRRIVQRAAGAGGRAPASSESGGQRRMEAAGSGGGTMECAPQGSCRSSIASLNCLKLLGMKRRHIGGRGEATQQDGRKRGGRGKWRVHITDQAAAGAPSTVAGAAHSQAALLKLALRLAAAKLLV